MRSWRILGRSLAINEVATEVAYLDVFVVVRAGEHEPGPQDWEATVTTVDSQRLAPGTYELILETFEGHELSGHAMLRFSDGHRHLFRGDGELGGVAAALA